MLRGRVGVLALAAACSAHPSSAQELRNGPGGEPPLELPRIPGGIRVDGVLDEPQWDGAVRLEGIVQVPDFGAEPSQRGIFLLAHDGEYLYLGCLMYEEDPDLIRVTTLERDVSPYVTDSCGMRIDSYNDEENSLVFITTPASVRTDWTFSNDASGPPNTRWDTYWDAEGEPTDFGWSAEIRVPFSSMGYQVVDGRAVMGFSVTRTIVRHAESIVHPAIPPNWGPASVAKPTQLRKMIIRGLDDPRRPVYVTPYGLVGGGLTTAPEPVGGAYGQDSETVSEVGGDLKVALTRNLNLDLTVNTDFAQVEADNLQVNLTRYSLFFPEQRRFFQERGAIFEVPLGGNERLFHSRRIGLVGNRAIPIYGGVRTVGRVGDWDVGFLNMQAQALDSIPSENLGVARLRRRFLNDASYAGAILTSRVGSDGSYNVLFGADASVRVLEQDFLTVNWAQSFTRGDPGRTGPLDRSLARVDWQRRGTDGVTYAANVIRAGSAFEPGLGYLRRRDYTATSGSVGYGWRPGAGAALNRYGFSVNGAFVGRNFDHSTESAAYGLSGSLQMRGGHQLDADVTRSYEDLRRPLPLSAKVAVPVGPYWFTAATVRFRGSQGGWFRPNANATFGGFYDGDRFSLGASPEWALSRYVRLGVAYELNHITFPKRDQTFVSHIGRVRTEFTFSTKTTFSAFVQYDSTDDLVAVNARFRFNPREGNDLYIVWNESFNSDRYALDPALPLTQDRTVLVKYSHTLTLGL